MQEGLLRQHGLPQDQVWIRSIDFRRLEAPAVGHFHNDWTPLTDDMQAGGDQPIPRDHKSRPPGIDDFKWLQDRPTVAK